MSIIERYTGAGARVDSVDRDRAARRRQELGALRHRLMIGDAVAIVLAVAAALILRFGSEPGQLGIGEWRVAYPVVGIVLAAVWWFALAPAHTRDPRVASVASHEARAIGAASLWVFGLLAVLAYAAKLEIARTFFVAALVLGCVALLADRAWCRRWVVQQRRAGHLIRRVLAIGERTATASFESRTEANPLAGYRVVGSLEPADAGPDGRHSDVTRVVAAAQSLGVDAVAFIASDRLAPEARRRIDWALGQSGVDVLVVPPLDATAGARLATEYVGSLPVIHVGYGSTGGRLLAKTVFDKLVAVLALGLFALPGLVIALAVKLSSPGPVLYRQERVGLNGQRFTMLKFRTMRVGAHAERAALADRDDGNGVLFKVHEDPRVTRVGRLLRRCSLDELPQFLNVLGGSMSVVGPRPPLPEEVARYDDAALRRLLVKPGITGLWQVSGRSDLSWEDSIRLDLHYVDTWNVRRDAALCLRTVRAMISGVGAY